MKITSNSIRQKCAKLRRDKTLTHIVKVVCEICNVPNDRKYVFLKCLKNTTYYGDKFFE